MLWREMNFQISRSFTTPCSQGEQGYLNRRANATVFVLSTRFHCD